MKMKKENWGFLGSPKHHRAVFYNIYERLKRYGKEVSPRSQKTIEIENFNVTFPPYVRFCNFRDRKFNLDYVKKEFIWYLKGNKYDTSIIEHAKLWKNFINNKGIINSNYGQYIFNKQFDFVIDELKRDKDSRRAVITILQPYHTIEDDLIDVPCTFGLSFRIRNNMLNMTVKMRSQDSYFGLASDIPTFSFIHEMIFVKLKEVYNELQYGEYHHFVESFHIYEKHFWFLDNLKNKVYGLIYCPQISTGSEVDFLIKHDFSYIPGEFKFSKWILDC